MFLFVLFYVIVCVILGVRQSDSVISHTGRSKGHVGGAGLHRCRMDRGHRTSGHYITYVDL